MRGETPACRADGDGGVGGWSSSIGAGGCVGLRAAVLCSHGSTPVVKVAILRVGCSTICRGTWLSGVDSGIGVGGDVVLGKSIGGRARVVWTMECAVRAVSGGDGVVVGVGAASCVSKVG